MIRLGKLSFPRGAPWLNDLLDELRAFPNGRNDDQVDALAHLLAYVRTHMPEKIVGPMVFEQDDTDGGGPTSDDDDYAFRNSM